MMGVMPRITTHALPLPLVQTVSRALTDELVALTGVPREHFTLEVRQDPFVADGELVPGDPFVEVALFDRGAEVESEIARAITRNFQAAGIAHLDVYLHRLERPRYYEDGEPF